MATPKSTRPMCTAHSSKTGDACRRRAVDGTTVCPAHGGKIPRVAKAAEVTRLTRSLADLSGAARPVTDPTAELMRLAGRAVRLLDVMEELTSELSVMRFATQGGEQTRAELAAYERAMDRVHRMLVDITKLDLEARMVRVSEVQAGVLVAALDAGLRAAGLRPGDGVWDSARSAAGKRLRSVTISDDSP